MCHSDTVYMLALSLPVVRDNSLTLIFAIWNWQSCTTKFSCEVFLCKCLQRLVLYVTGEVILTYMFMFVFVFVYVYV